MMNESKHKVGDRVMVWAKVVETKAGSADDVLSAMFGGIWGPSVRVELEKEWVMDGDAKAPARMKEDMAVYIGHRPEDMVGWCAALAGEG